MGRVLVVEAPEGIFWHTVGSSSVQVAVPVDLQCHDSTLPSGGEQVMGSPSAQSASTRLSADQDLICWLSSHAQSNTLFCC